MDIDVGFDRRSDPKRYDRIWRRIYNKQNAHIKRKLADYKYLDKKNKYEGMCDYTYDELLYILSTNTCYYCESADQLGLDRIDNSKGHLKENTIVACYTCNTIRGDAYTVEEMKAIRSLLDQIVKIRHEIDHVITEMRKKDRDR